MGVDWGEYLGTEDPYEIEDMLRDEGIREQERIQNGDYDDDDKKNMSRRSTTMIFRSE